MLINYKYKKVEKQCESLKQAKKYLPEKVAKKLINRINFIKSSENLASVISFRPLRFHSLRGDKNGFYAMDIDGKKCEYRIISTFDGYKREQVFTESKSITIIEITEVSKHYE